MAVCSLVKRAANLWLRRPIHSAARCIRSRTKRGKKNTTAMSTPIPAMMLRLPRNRSNRDRPSTLPRCPSDRPAPKNTASGPAMAKNNTVATKLMKVDVTATGRGTP
jgi:hypothetical protein